MQSAKQFKTWVEVDTKTLIKNVEAISRAIPGSVRVIAVVKSNAYGHGLVLSAKKLQTIKRVSMFAVDSITEAIELKDAGIKKPILILGYIPEVMLKEALAREFRMVMYHIPTLTTLGRIAKRMHKTAYVHIKIETGTFRQGVMPEDWEACSALIEAHPEISMEGIYTHFSDTEDTVSMYYKKQLDMFTRACEVFRTHDIHPAYVHASSTAASMMYRETHCTAVRLGIGMYGMYPSNDVRTRSRVALIPILSWKTRIAQVKNIQKGDAVSYDRTYIAKGPTTIAVLPVGYWDGFDRGFSNNGEVLVHGERCPVVGRVCMNMCMIDISRVREVSPGDEVVLLGGHGGPTISAEELGKRVGTINYEITTRINPLIPRIGI